MRIGYPYAVLLTGIFFTISATGLPAKQFARTPTYNEASLKLEFDGFIAALDLLVLDMFREMDDGNTHAYAASMARYLGLHEFERELEHCLESRHPAVVNKAKWALESLERQKEYDMISQIERDDEKKL